jgi:hypothetical protein
MNKNSALKTIGNAAVVLSFMFVWKKFADLDVDKAILFRSENVTHILWISFLYGLQMFILCVPWKMFLSIISNRKVPFSEAAWVLNRSNLMKYLPGNVFQFIGRNELAIRLDLRHTDVAFATVCDIALSVGGVFFMAFFLNWRGMGKWFERYGLSVFYVPFILSFTMGMAVALLWLTCKSLLLNLTSKAKIFFTRRAVRTVFACLLYDMLLSLFVSMLFVAVFLTILQTDVEARTIPILLSAYLLSWIAGFLTPGAPGGIGIREATLTLLLTDVVPVDDALLAAVIFRLITIIGDFWGLLFAWICLKLRKKLD